ncbi:MAG TPA: glycosyltransferase [Thermoanaerobaculia bacterium]|nr:glycosyltransferase [Thermoanaerobaculia bacterium]
MAAVSRPGGGPGVGGRSTAGREVVSPAVSVVIPTWNRMDTLPEVLAALERQEDAPSFEVIVVDDGSTDDTPRWLAGRPAGGLALRTLAQANRGPAAARNAGVAAARGHRVAFLGDDTVPSAGWLRRIHDAVERRADPRIAVIGRTEWHPRVRVTPFLRHINQNGAQFGFALIADPDSVPFNFFYTSNLCLGRSLLLEEPFDETFPFPAWEDIETSYRLQAKGMHLCYEPAAEVCHDHPTDLDRFCLRQEKAGYSAVVFHRRHPELGPMLGLGLEGPPSPLGIGWRLGRVVARALQRLPLVTPGLWDEVLRGHYIIGLNRGWAELAPRSAEAGGEA